MARSGYGSRIEGLHPVTAALAAGRVLTLTVAATRRKAPELQPVLAAAASSGVPVEFSEAIAASATTDAHQGVLATARPIPYVDLASAVAATEPAALLVVDHVEDPRNLGAIARTALAGGFRALVVPTRRAAPLEATAFKASAGALEHLRVAGVSSIADSVVRLRDMGVWTVGLDAGADRSLFGLDLLAEPVAVVVGAEDRGLSRLVAERVDMTAAVPLVGPIESLNVAVAAALAVYETARLRGWAAYTPGDPPG